MARKKPAPIIEPPPTIKIDDAKKAKKISGQAVPIAEAAARALGAAEELGVKTNRLENLTLSPSEREVILAVTTISKSIKNKLVKEKASFTIAEVVSMAIALAADSTNAEPRRQIAVLLVANHLTEQLQAGSTSPLAIKSGNQQKAKPDLDLLFQFKITLLDIQPAIWRRIQVPDCSLADLHKYIQGAFGWDDFHLHKFEIDGVKYGRSAPDEDDYDMSFENERDTLLSNLIPKSGRKSPWIYVYDFSDGWQHEIRFEGVLPNTSKAKYAACVDGERACPPEDSGGPWGYAHYLAAIVAPKHGRNEEEVERPCHFDPEAFDEMQATAEMRKAKVGGEVSPGLVLRQFLGADDSEVHTDLHTD